MLRRNNLIASEDAVRLDAWVRTIEWALAMLLDAGGDSMDAALEECRRISGRARPPAPEPWPPPGPGQETS
jgi:hypothetical protein